MTIDPYDPQCPYCHGFLFGDVDPCDCAIYKPDQIALALRYTALTMRRTVSIMRGCAGFGRSKRLLLQHAAEMDGAADMCIEWAENLEARPNES